MSTTAAFLATVSNEELINEIDIRFNTPVYKGFPLYITMADGQHDVLSVYKSDDGRVLFIDANMRGRR